MDPNRIKNLKNGVHHHGTSLTCPSMGVPSLGVCTFKHFSVHLQQLEWRNKQQISLELNVIETNQFYSAERGNRDPNRIKNHKNGGHHHGTCLLCPSMGVPSHQVLLSTFIAVRVKKQTTNIKCVLKTTNKLTKQLGVNVFFFLNNICTIG